MRAVLALEVSELTIWCSVFWSVIYCVLDLYKNSGYAKKGQILNQTDVHSLPGTSVSTGGGRTYTITLMTTLSGDLPIVIDLREGSNTQWDFLNFLNFLIDKKHLIEGDVLVVDNATLHFAKDSSCDVSMLLEVAKIKLVFLPTYSPELNPCEGVFAHVKNYLRFNRGGSRWDKEIMFAFSLISEFDIFDLYWHCIWLDFQKKELRF